MAECTFQPNINGSKAKGLSHSTLRFNELYEDGAKKRASQELEATRQISLFRPQINKVS